ncbi:hypothetical protein SDC9_110991 [bioreactor metagenome]|uniref:Uncharacterized protein n=1 Tax=bioreactor metagenome TaxID=1076179 RepID=A0A645BF71_9ZZZZ
MIEVLVVRCGYFNIAETGVKKAGFVNLQFITFDDVVRPYFGVIPLRSTKLIPFFKRFRKEGIIECLSAANPDGLARAPLYFNFPPPCYVLA